MIHVERRNLKPPTVLVGHDSLAAKELEKVREFVRERQQRAIEAAATPAESSGRKEKKSFDFSVYSHQEIKDALARLFHGKCAYCETRYAATQPVDVEHFRPKAGVDEDPAHFGYYWLAADWDNLLPSCIDCNRERTHELGDSAQPGVGTPKRRVKLGKGNRFPLAAGSARAVSPDDKSVERPLLLDPCRDQPEDALEFTDQGVARPRDGAGEALEERAQVSIEVYGLNRTNLVLNRLEVLLLVQGRMFTIQRLTQILDEEPSPTARDLIEDLLSHELAQLDRFRDRTRPYTLMCTQVIERFLSSLTGLSLETRQDVAGREFA
jgi:uncharacterized protein (TIGR02646 family)